MGLFFFWLFGRFKKKKKAGIWMFTGVAGFQSVGTLGWDVMGCHVMPFSHFYFVSY